MKRLTLLRHAKSGLDDADLRDFDRGLNPKGRRAARAIGREMRESGLSFDAVLASSARRVMETVEEVSAGFGRVIAAEYDSALYLAPAATLLERVQQAPDAAKSLLVIGHNPGLEELVLMLVPDSADDEVRDRVELKYPTASLVELSFGADRWAECRPGSARLTRFVRPRDLDPTLGPNVD